MTLNIWSVCRLTLLVTFLWMLLLVLAFLEEGRSEGTTKGCAVHIQHHERQQGIPSGLLYAISKVESGKKNAMGQIVPWPWTINAEGKGYYFPTKEIAIQAVQKMQRAGIKSIDIGCMQVNLYHHPFAFKSLHDAFDPAKNVAYAARFLKGLKKEYVSWSRAVARYHSANPVHHVPYQKAVLAVWNKDINQGGAFLTADFMQSDSSSVRVHRLQNLKTLSLGKNSAAQDSSPHIRRATPGNSTHITRPSRSSRKGLKIS